MPMFVEALITRLLKKIFWFILQLFFQIPDWLDRNDSIFPYY